MEAGTRQLGLGAGTKQWLLIFAAAAAITAVLFGLLFEGTAHLTAWVLSLGLDHLEKIHPGLRFWITVGPSFATMGVGIAISLSHSRKKARATPVRRRQKTLL